MRRPRSKGRGYEGEHSEHVVALSPHPLYPTKRCAAPALGARWSHPLYSVIGFETKVIQYKQKTQKHHYRQPGEHPPASPSPRRSLESYGVFNDNALGAANAPLLGGRLAITEKQCPFRMVHPQCPASDNIICPCGWFSERSRCVRV
eukprot:gene12517-biopygen18491